MALFPRGIHDHMNEQTELDTLRDLFATVDMVFDTEGAFDDRYIKISLGRCYRQWKKTRAILDPTFNPKDYPKTTNPAWRENENDPF